MIKKVTIGDVRVTFSVARITRVIGVNSRLADDRHIIMWDFDDMNLGAVEKALIVVQFTYGLSDIYILETKKDTNFIAYCFTALPFREVSEVVLATDYVDWNFFKYGVYRGRFTLRVTPKNGRTPRLVKVLKSEIKPDVKLGGLTSWVRYQTLKR